MQYRIVFRGELVDHSYDLQEVKQQLAVLYKVPVNKIEHFFSGESTLIKDKCDETTARKIQTAFAKVGAKCIVTPLSPPVPSQSSSSSNAPLIMICPKCGFEQPKAEICSRCKIIIAKYRPPKPKLTPPPPPPSPSLTTTFTEKAKRTQQTIVKQIKEIKDSQESYSSPSHSTKTVTTSGSQRSILVAYLLWCTGLFGFCGIHRFYLGNYISGFLYLFTVGLFGIGQLIDLFLIPSKVKSWNYRNQVTVLTQHTASSFSPSPSPVDKEKEVLRLAQRNQGSLTLSEIVADTSLSFTEAEEMMQQIVNKGYAAPDVNKAGVTIYKFGFVQTSQQSQRQQSIEDVDVDVEKEIPHTKQLRCIVTDRLIQDTPEERIRQDVAMRLIREYFYSRQDMEIEFPIKVGQARKRADIVIFYPDLPHEEENIYLIVETKAPHINSQEAKEALAQLKSYVAASMNCKYALFAWQQWQPYQIVISEGRRMFQKIQELPQNIHDRKNK